MNTIKTIEQMVEALETCTPQDTSTGHVIYAWHDEEAVEKAIQVGRALLEELKGQEPIGEAHQMQEGFTHCIWSDVFVPVGTKIYTHPQPAQPNAEQEPNPYDEVQIAYGLPKADHIPDATKMVEQEPVAWRWRMSLVQDRYWQYSEHAHPDALSKEPLYTHQQPKAEQPCQTCEALARTVMMDQTGSDK